MKRNDRFIWKPGDVVVIKNPETERGLYLLNTDGGIAAKQGQAAGEGAIGAVLKDPHGAVVGQISKRIGWVTDHHVAEYRALIEGLKLARGHRIDYIGVFLDSRVVVNQVSGIWKYNAELEPLCGEARALVEEFADIQISWLPREWNAEADALASKAIDR